MYKCINGWTKAKMIEQIYKKNNGTKATSFGRCVYETPDNNHCAVGCFIPEGHAALQSKDTVQYLLERYPDLQSKMPLSGYHMLMFQIAHDDSYGWNIRDVREVLKDWVNENVAG
jgi:ADP-dependent phosphofructokinase/glucokinase